MLRLPAISIDDVLLSMDNIKPRQIKKGKYKCKIKYRDRKGRDRTLTVFCRQAKKLKQKTLSRLRRLSFKDEGDMCDILHEQLDDTTVFYIRIDGLIRAWALISSPYLAFELDNNVHPAEFFVQEDYRNQGLATILATIVLRHTKIAKQKPVFYGWNESSQRFFYKMANTEINNCLVDVRVD